MSFYTKFIFYSSFFISINYFEIAQVFPRLSFTGTFFLSEVNGDNFLTIHGMFMFLIFACIYTLLSFLVPAQYNLSPSVLVLSHL